MPHHTTYERELAGETRRGGRTLYWEEVNVGEEIPSMLKGPYDVSDAVSFADAIGSARPLS